MEQSLREGEIQTSIQWNDVSVELQLRGELQDFSLQPQDKPATLQENWASFVTSSLSYLDFTSLISVQWDPLPEYPGGQGPQRKPVPVSVQATPGKQEFGRHLLNCVTVMTGPVASVCMPRGQEEH